MVNNQLLFVLVLLVVFVYGLLGVVLRIKSGRGAILLLLLGVLMRIKIWCRCSCYNKKKKKLIIYHGKL